MKKNMSSADRAIRLLLAAIIVVIYFSNIITGTLGIVFLSLAGIFILTSLVGFCPFYTLLGINNHEMKNMQ